MAEQTTNRQAEVDSLRTEADKGLAAEKKRGQDMEAALAAEQEARQGLQVELTSTEKRRQNFEEELHDLQRTSKQYGKVSCTDMVGVMHSI